MTFRISEIVPNAKVVWNVEEKDHTTTSQFTHLGLLPAVECYDMCVKGWNQYVNSSLLKLLTENRGEPA